MKLIWLILVAALPCQAAMTVTRELVAPEHVVPVPTGARGGDVLDGLMV